LRFFIKTFLFIHKQQNLLEPNKSFVE
jgi:hypothetical protein